MTAAKMSEHFFPRWRWIKFCSLKMNGWSNVWRDRMQICARKKEKDANVNIFVEQQSTRRQNVCIQMSFSTDCPCVLA